MGNDGVPYDPSWFSTIKVNKSATVQRAGELLTRRSVKKKWQLAWEIRAIQCIDLTTLAGDDTSSNVKRLCAKAKNPLNADVLSGLGITSLTTGAVCVYPNHVAEAGQNFFLQSQLFFYIRYHIKIVIFLFFFIFLFF